MDLLLDSSLSQYYESPAEFPQSPGMGRVCSFDLFYCFTSFLVSRNDSGSGYSAGPIAEQSRLCILRRARVGMARRVASLEISTDGFFAACRLGDSSGSIGSHGCELRLHD